MLEIRDLSKKFGPVVALDGCSFTSLPGRILGLLGPNGAGKTTTMRSIFGLVRLDRGEVRWNGASMDMALRQRAGYMPEERGLYPRMRVGDQVAYFARLHGLDGKEAVASASTWLRRFDLGDREHVRLEELSHGNQQRVQLAVALVSRPDLLVLDEPFAGLDPIGVAMMGEVIRGEAERGAVVVFSSHQLDLVQDLCDDVAIMARGKVSLAGDLAQIRRSSPSRYVDLSFSDAVDDVALAAWASRLEGLDLLWLRGGEVRLRASTGVDPATILEAARTFGEVSYFRYEPPSVSYLFHEAVTG
jgi:ABC-2 type transport system ATP-binding protein